MFTLTVMWHDSSCARKIHEGWWGWSLGQFYRLATRWYKHWLSISGDRAQWANRVLHNAEIIISLWIYLHFLLPCAIKDWPAFIWSVYYNPMLVLLHLQASGTQHFCLCNWWNSDLLFWDSRQPASCFGISMHLELVYLFRWQSLVQRRLTLIYALDHFTLVYVVWTELVVIYLMISISWYRNLNLSSKACVMMFFVKPKLLLQFYGIMNNAFWWFKGTNLSVLYGYIVFDIS